MNLSRRAFLTGAVVTAATVVLPALPAPMENPCKTVILPDWHFGMRRSAECRYFLYPSQWEMFERAGIDMHNCVRVNMNMAGDIVSGDLHERQAIRFPVSGDHPKRKYGPRPRVEAHIRSFRREA